MSEYISPVQLSEHLETQISENVESYRRLIYKYCLAVDEGFVPLYLSFTWGGLILPFAWLFHRNLILFGLVAMAVNAIPWIMLFSRYDTPFWIFVALGANAFISIVTAVFGKSYYVRRLAKKFWAIYGEATEDISALDEFSDDPNPLGWWLAYAYMTGVATFFAYLVYVFTTPGMMNYK